MNAQEAADILGVNRRRHDDLREMVRALTLFPWFNSAEDESAERPPVGTDALDRVSSGMLEASGETLREGRSAHGLPLTDPSQFDILQSGLGCGDRMQFHQLTRREFITLLGGAAAAWPLAARAAAGDR